MSAKTMSSLRDENRDLRKQIGCMNGILQLFDRHHKRLLQGTQHQLEPQYAARAVSEKALESHKENPIISTESSRASYTSSSCSSTFSSLDFNQTTQPETLSLRQKNKSESPFPITPTKEPRSLDLRDVVKDSMHREARGLPIKTRAPKKDENKGTVMKYVDSPRLPHQSKPKTLNPSVISKGSSQVLGGAHEITRISKNERQALGLHRFSYDGGESRDGLRWTAKQKELPRLSLDSKTSSMKKSLAEKSRSNFLDRDPHVENENLSHNRTSSIVAKLMGLENFPDPSFTDENRTPTLRAQNHASYYSPCFPQNDPTSQSPRFQSENFDRRTKMCSRIPIEPAPWRQQDSGQGSPKMAIDKRRAPTNSRSLSSSVYGEIEKRMTELQFQKAGKDLRALKQILEAMQKTRERLEERMGESVQYTLQRKSNDRVLTIKGPCNPQQLVSTVVIKQADFMEKATFPVSQQKKFRTRKPRYHVENSAPGKKTKEFTSKNNTISTGKRTSWGAPEHDRSTLGHQCKKVVVSPRLQHRVLRIEGQSPPTTPSPDSAGVKNHHRKNLTEKGSQNSKVKAKNMQLSDGHLTVLSSGTRQSSYHHDTASVVSESNNSQVLQAATEVIDLVHLVNPDAAQKENSVSTTTREQIHAVKTVITIPEQPSPISVLDDTFYGEDPPSPVKKISTVFQDAIPSPDEAQRHLENLNHLTEYTSKVLTKPNPTAVDHHTLMYRSLNPDHKYINKILLTSGLLKDPSVISLTDHLLSSCHLINPNMFHILELTEEISSKSDMMQLNKKIERKLIFDMVDELLVRKITSGGVFTSGHKLTSPQVLLKDVYLGMDRICKIPDGRLDDEEDEMIRLLTADIMYQDDWVSYGGEVSALVLDIERLIFKDLINEVVTSEGTGGLRDSSLRHCRKLFSK
ncbi:protein LONGIFOLIA 2 [Striga asiatica]|uniref:Protein LONGIFOLIA 2 n=1 Tax=Striga asiatica TaxID=4170 RepID=A0A5A7QJ11_STRAF|nr:protein LONGIFOLIA 2 [Striga asiatica]